MVVAAAVPTMVPAPELVALIPSSYNYMSGYFVALSSQRNGIEWSPSTAGEKRASLRQVSAPRRRVWPGLSWSILALLFRGESATSAVAAIGVSSFEGGVYSGKRFVGVLSKRAIAMFNLSRQF